MVREDVLSRHIEKADRTATVSLDWSDLGAIIEDDLLAVYAESSGAIAKALGVGPFDQVNEWAAEYAKTRSGTLIGDITQTTLDRIRAAEEQAFKDGLDPSQLGDLIDEIIDDPARAELIARTEVADAQSESALETAKDSGVVSRKVWLLSDDDPCLECQANADVGEIDIDDDFPSGDAAPTVHPRCQCDCAFIIDEEAA